MLETLEFFILLLNFQLIVNVTSMQKSIKEEKSLAIVKQKSMENSFAMLIMKSVEKIIVPDSHLQTNGLITPFVIARNIQNLAILM